MSSRRVVVTGIGMITPLGVGTELSWNSLLNGTTSISRLDSRYAKLPCRIGAVVPKSDEPKPGSFSKKSFSDADWRQMSLAMAFALQTSDETLKDAGWNSKTSTDPQRCGVCIGTGMIDLDEIYQTGVQFYQNDAYRKISPYFVPKILPNMSAGMVSIRHGLKGPNHSASTACTTGLHSIGDAFTMIKLGRADAMLCGGTEACISPLATVKFSKVSKM